MSFLFILSIVLLLTFLKYGLEWALFYSGISAILAFALSLN